MQVIWTSRAERHLADICDYIAMDAPNAAERMDAVFRKAASRLADFPLMGKTVDILPLLKQGGSYRVQSCMSA